MGSSWPQTCESSLCLAQLTLLNGLLQVPGPEQVFLIPWPGICSCPQALNQMCHLLLLQFHMALLCWKFTDFRVRPGYCNIWSACIATKNFSSNNIEHTTLWTVVFFTAKRLCIDLKYANDEKSTTHQHKLFQWLISTLKNLNFILTYFDELSSLWLYF